MEIFGIILLMNLCIFGYFTYSFIQFRKNEKYRTQELNHKVQCLLDQAQRDYKAEREAELSEKPKTNIFREHAIKEVASQRLIFDAKTGQYIRLRQIN